MTDNDIIGFIIVHPHGTYIANGSKKIIIKSKRFLSILNRPLLLIENKKSLGIIYIKEINEINLKQFDQKRHLHLITTEERKKWWPNKKILYEYPISKKYIFVAPIPVQYKTGPQVFVKLKNIKVLQKVYIGTSGYNYNWWKDFYQNKTKSEDQFVIYSERFSSLEINGTFYRNFDKKIWQKLKDMAPSNFVYSVKVNRSITHYYQFQKFNQFWSNAKLLLPKLKCLLFQFPEHFNYSVDNIDRLRNLSTEIRCAFEFRNKSWFNQDVYNLFKQKKKWSIVISYHGFKWSDKSDLEIGFNPKLNEWPVTSDFVYIRMHGTIGKYEGSHKKVLPKLGRFIRDIYNEKIKYAFVYFNNTDFTANAVCDAIKLQDLIGF